MENVGVVITSERRSRAEGGVGAPQAISEGVEVEALLWVVVVPLVVLVAEGDMLRCGGDVWSLWDWGCNLGMVGVGRRADRCGLAVVRVRSREAGGL